MIGIIRRFYAEAHFQSAFVNMPSKDAYGVAQDNVKVHGFFAQASWLILGEQQNYNKRTGLAQSASPKNLELLVRFANTDLDDYGTVNDITVGVNYFISRYLNAKLNYVHSAVKDGDDHNLIQARMTFSF